MATGTDYLLRRLRLRHLELLVTLADAGTVRGAAGRLSLSQPAISKMLGEIEEALGARLFERSHQGVQPNALGTAAIYRARVVLSELGRIGDDLGALLRGATAVLRVGAPSVTATVPAAIVQLRARMPGTSVRITEGPVRELIRRLLDGELDCVFGAITPELMAGDELPLLQSEVLVEDRLCVLAAASNPLVRRRGLRWADLRAADWVAPPKQTLVRQGFMTAFANEGVDPPEPAIEVMSSVTIGAVLRMDPSLLCAVRFDQARDEVARGDVRRLRVEPAVALPSLGLFTRRGAGPQPATVQAFARAVRRAGAG
ncbi:DNA-binding transcriptional LysR family regulator [Variovorax sp. TBS-050B]|uniref:LysR family transcriptional regulator n=1 Tax=Variovorax sp. TBS-050B TaxID=2940551 RepID=UPI0024756ED3|nr:LysR family transcriptional regulator [Variovorax sp. TBS-050B]MDH6590558.1 DNA-binding transcriptional LysR family regulator [Variovorax sp. TBS-050B]